MTVSSGLVVVVVVVVVVIVMWIRIPKMCDSRRHVPSPFSLRAARPDF
jgi:hypothetical protein